MSEKILTPRGHRGIRFGALASSLFLILIAEAVVLFLQLQGMAIPIAQLIMSTVESIKGPTSVLWDWLWKMVGPVVFPLLALTVLEIWSFIKLVECKIFNYEEMNASQYIRNMSIIEGSAPGFGFLGTCIGLIATMRGMDPQLNQVQMLKAVFDNSASAFGSTIFGILLAISAFIIKEIFRRETSDLAS